MAQPRKSPAARSAAPGGAAPRAGARSAAPAPGGDGSTSRARQPVLQDMVGVLTCTEGPDPGATLSLSAGREYSIGRGRDNDLVLKDIVCSRRHLRVVVAGDQVRVVDMGSGNGTRVNGKRVRESLLANGDTVEIGISTMAFSVNAGVAVRTGPPPAAASPRNEPWMDMRTMHTGTDPKALHQQFLEESLRAVNPDAPPARNPRNEPTRTTVGERRRRLSRSTTIIAVMVGVGVALVAFSITAAVMLTRNDGADGAVTEKMVLRAVELELQGESTKADAVLDLLKEQDPARHAVAAERVMSLRGKVKRVGDAPPAATPAPAAAAAPAPVERKPDPAPAEAAPAADRAAEDAREAERRAEANRRAEEQRRAAQRRDAERREAERRDAERREAERREAARREAARREAARKPVVKKLSNDDAMELFKKASALARDDQYKEAIRVLKDILARAEDGTARKKAEAALPRYERLAEGD